MTERCARSSGTACARKLRRLELVAAARARARDRHRRARPGGEPLERAEQHERDSGSRAVGSTTPCGAPTSLVAPARAPPGDLPRRGARDAKRDGDAERVRASAPDEPRAAAAGERRAGLDGLSRTTSASCATARRSSPRARSLAVLMRADERNHAAAVALPTSAAAQSTSAAAP